MVEGLQIYRSDRFDLDFDLTTRTANTMIIQSSSVSRDTRASIVDIRVLPMSIHPTMRTGSGLSWTCIFDQFGSG